MEKAIEMYNTTNATVEQAASKFKVPRSSLHDR